MGTRSRIALQVGNKFTSIYCHWDGYLGGVGATLVNHYTDLDKVSALIALGDISSLGKEIGTKHNFEGSHDSVVNSYARDRGETDVEAQTAGSLEELLKQADNSGGEYVYIFQDGVWLATWHGEFRAFGMGPGDGETSPWRDLQPVETALSEEKVAEV